MRILRALFLLSALFSWFYNDFFVIAPAAFSIVNSVCIAIPCFFYFREIFKSPPLTNLIHQPAFWIVSGFLFMVVCTLPFYLLQDYIYENMFYLFDQMYVLNNVFYCLLFLLISKAFLCKQEIAR